MSRQTFMGAVIVLVIVVLAWWFWPTGEGPVEPSPEVAPVEPARTIQPDEPEPDPLPPLDASDPLAAEALRAAGGAQGALAGALEQDALIRRFVTAVAAVAEGRSPAGQIPFLEPAEQFRVDRGDDRVLVDPRSFERYSALSAAISGLNSDELVQRYHTMEPLFQDAYAELGVDGAFRVTLLQALDVLLATPVPELPIELEDRVEYYAYADDRLQALNPAQKHLLRLGPDNQRLVMAELRTLRAGVRQLP